MGRRAGTECIMAYHGDGTRRGAWLVVGQVQRRIEGDEAAPRIWMGVGGCACRPLDEA
jgi:hypothetical protein